MGAKWDALPKQVADERVLVDPVAVEKEHRTSRVDPLHIRPCTHARAQAHTPMHRHTRTCTHACAHTPVLASLRPCSRTQRREPPIDSHRLTHARERPCAELCKQGFRMP